MSSNHTLHSRALQLLQRSRQAFRLYSHNNSATGSANDRSLSQDPYDLQEIQKKEWRNINAELIRALGRILDISNNRHLSQNLFELRESLMLKYRECQANLRQQHEALVSATEVSDYLILPKLGLDLICLKAQSQAQQAALHELDSLLSNQLQGSQLQVSQSQGSQRQSSQRQGSQSQGIQLQGSQRQSSQLQSSQLQSSQLQSSQLHSTQKTSSDPAQRESVFNLQRKQIEAASSHKHASNKHIAKVIPIRRVSSK